MRALLDRGCVTIDGENFRLTSEGELLLAPRVRVDGAKVTVMRGQF